MQVTSPIAALGVTSTALASDGDDAITNDATDELRTNDLSGNPFIRGDAYEGVADSNGIITIKTAQRPRGVMVLESPFLCSASIAYTKNGITTIRLTRQWEFLERHEVKQQTQNFNFKETVRSGTDTDYRMVCYWVANTPAETGPNLYWYINNQSTGLSNDGSDYNFGSFTTDGLLLGTNPTTDGSHYIVSTMLASETKRFTHTQHVHELGTATGSVEADFIGSKWVDSTEIKTLGAETSTILGIDVGSWFDLYRRPQFDKTPLKLWVY